MAAEPHHRQQKLFVVVDAVLAWPAVISWSAAEPWTMPRIDAA